MFSLTYGFVLQALPIMEFKDAENYYSYAADSAIILSRYMEQGLVSVLANEPVWLTINIVLAQFAEPVTVMRTIIFASSSLFAFYLTRADPRNSFWLVVFLLMPQLLKNFMTHLRQGLAIAIFFAGYFSHGRFLRWINMAIAPFIHASFFFIIPFILLPNILRRMQLAVDIRLLTMGLFSLFISLSLGLWVQLLGARQAEQYSFAMAEVSGLGFVYWLAILALFISQGKGFLQSHQRGASILLFYLLSYFFIEVTARIFESGMPIVLLAGLAMRDWRRWIFILSFLSYSAIQWSIRLLSGNPF